MTQSNEIQISRFTISTNALKILAIIAMVSDHLPYLSEYAHINYYSIPTVFMHAFGRITAPVFFYLLALGYRRTRNPNKYTIRLFVFALISYVPFIWYFEGGPPDSYNFLKLNVIFTMLFGLLMIRSIDEVQNIVLKAAAIFLCLLAGFWTDYGLFGLGMILVCHLAGESRKRTIFGLGAVIMVQFYTNTSAFFSDGVSPFNYGPMLFQNPNLIGYIFILLCQLLPLIFISRHIVWFRGAKAEKKPHFLAKWGFYIFYPAHITLLLLFRLMVLS